MRRSDRAGIAGQPRRSGAGDEPSVRRTSDCLERFARVQAVKCVPRGNKSYPEPAMRERCPRRFAAPELEMLAPGTVVALGADGEAAVQSVSKDGIEWLAGSKTGLRRGIARLPHGNARVCRLPHPSAHGGAWDKAQKELIEYLRAHPLSNV